MDFSRAPKIIAVQNAMSIRTIVLLSMMLTVAHVIYCSPLRPVQAAASARGVKIQPFARHATGGMAWQAVIYPVFGTSHNSPSASASEATAIMRSPDRRPACDRRRALFAGKAFTDQYQAGLGAGAKTILASDHKDRDARSGACCRPHQTQHELGIRLTVAGLATVRRSRWNEMWPHSLCDASSRNPMPYKAEEGGPVEEVVVHYHGLRDERSGI